MAARRFPVLLALLTLLASTVMAAPPGVVTPEDVGPGRQQMADIDGTRVAYEVQPTGQPTRVRVRDVLTDQYWDIPSAPGSWESDPSIHGDLVAFRRGSYAFLYDLATGQLQTLPEAGFRPHLGRTGFAYERGVVVGGQIVRQGVFVYDRLSSTVVDLSALNAPTTLEWNSRISPEGDLVVWERCYNHDQFNCDIRVAKRVSPGVWRSDPVTTSTSNECCADTDGRIITYLQGTLGSSGPWVAQWTELTPSGLSAPTAIMATGSNGAAPRVHQGLVFVPTLAGGTFLYDTGTALAPEPLFAQPLGLWHSDLSITERGPIVGFSRFGFGADPDLYAFVPILNLVQTFTVTSDVGDVATDTMGRSFPSIASSGHMGCTALDANLACTGGAWPTIPGAKWIWRPILPRLATHLPPPPPRADVAVLLFSKDIVVPDALLDVQGTIRISADNAYMAFIDGNFIGAEGNLNPYAGDREDYWTNVESHPVRLSPGPHKVEIIVSNYEGCELHSCNPGGLAWRIDAQYLG